MYMPYRSGIKQHLPLRVERHIQAPELVLVQEADGAFVLESIDMSVSYNIRVNNKLHTEGRIHSSRANVRLDAVFVCASSTGVTCLGTQDNATLRGCNRTRV